MEVMLVISGGRPQMTKERLPGTMFRGRQGFRDGFIKQINDVPKILFCFVSSHFSILTSVISVSLISKSFLLVKKQVPTIPGVT